jgi:hypothetical protein
MLRSSDGLSRRDRVFSSPIRTRRRTRDWFRSGCDRLHSCSADSSRWHADRDRQWRVDRLRAAALRQWVQTGNGACRFRSAARGDPIPARRAHRVPLRAGSASIRWSWSHSSSCRDSSGGAAAPRHTRMSERGLAAARARTGKADLANSTSSGCSWLSRRLPRKRIVRKMRSAASWGEPVRAQPIAACRTSRLE